MSTPLHEYHPKPLCGSGARWRIGFTLYNIYPIPKTYVCVQWGPVEYHAQSLANLAVAMQRTKRLCATILDTVGREIMIIRPFSLDDVRPPKPYPALLRRARSSLPGLQR